MSSQSPQSKIDFKKKTPVAHVRKNISAPSQFSEQPYNKKQDISPKKQMRLITDTRGYFVDVNDTFSAALGIPPKDLIGRRLLDVVLFKNFDDLIDDRAVFNNLSHGENTGLSNLRAGPHVLMIGREHEAHEFQFDWIRSSQNGYKYLVGCSVNADKPDWNDIIQTLPNNNKAIATVSPVKSPEPFKPAKEKPKKTVIKDALLANDIDVFASLNDDLMCVLSHDGQILRSNDEFIRLVGINDGTTTILDYVHHDDRASLRQFINNFQRHDAEDGFDACGVIDFETRMKPANQSSSLWVSWRARIADDNCLYCLGHDITAAKTIELSLKRRELELSEAQALALMGHWRWTVGADTIEWSDQIYKIFGVSRDDFIPTLDSANALLHKRDIGHMMQAFQRALIEQNNYDIDFRVMRADNSIRYVRCEGRCDFDDDGDVIALYGVMQDITEQTEHEMELRAAKDSAEQAYASKSRFLANMSHELRTPLNAIIGFSDMIHNQMLGAVGNDKYLDYAQSINDSGKHLLSLITDILDMSKIEAGKYELDLEKIQLGDVIHTAIRMIESRATEGALKIDASAIDAKEPVIVADRRAVMQIMLNVLSNAVKFTLQGGVISVAIDEFQNHISIKVTDTGIGIPANKLSAVLRPFEQVSTAFTRNHEGSGLGLAITKELAELHGGMISLDSREGQGTCVSIRLPKDANAKVERQK